MKVKSILVSQPAPAVLEKSPFHEITTKYHAQITYRPFIRVEGVSLKEYRSQRTEILDHTAVIFSSRTTVDHFFRICEEARITVPETMKYLCNTEAVALYLQKYIVYRKRKISFANGTFPSFMELILKHKDEKLLLILSEPHKPELPLTMEKLKLNFHKIILSRTVSSDLSDLDLQKYDLLAFYSPAEINTLITKFGTENLPLITTFGEGTTRAAIAAGLTVNAMAPTPEAPSMTKAIDIFLRKLETGEEIPPVALGDNRQADEFIKAQEAKPSRKTRSLKKTDIQSKKSAKPKSTVRKSTAKPTTKKAATPVSKSIAVAGKSTIKSVAKPSAK